MFKKLRQMGEAIQQGMAASREAIANGGRLTEQQLAAMPPDVRAQYEAQMAQMQATADAVIEAELARRVLLGPAGEHLYGPLPDRERMTDPHVGRQLEHAKSDLKDVLRNPLGRRPTPMIPPPVSTDPAAQAAHEQAQRDEARTPYLSPGRVPITLTRIATDRKQCVEQLCGWLGTSGLAGRPDLVYGVARVPDHLPGGFGIGKAKIVEWEIVHAAQTALPAAPPAAVAAFDAEETWAARRPGEPSVLDEDLGLEYLRFADLGPEQCLGIARRLEVDASSGGGDDGGSTPYVLVGVTGVLVLHPAGLGTGAVDRMLAARPLQVVPPPDVHVALLNWSAIRRVVAPRGDRRALVPSPFPYLPSSARELLHSYLSIVGVRPEDCYSAQVTQDQPSNIIGGTAHVTTTGAESEPAADGEVRKRFRGGARVVVVYRDSTEYAAGRERWASYQEEVLQARLERGTALRAPVEKQSALDRGGLGSLLRGTEAVADFVTGEGGVSTRFDTIPHHRYCWPPVQ